MKYALLGSEFDESDLAELLISDEIGRSSRVSDFLTRLAYEDGARTYWLDEPWGNGKTVFCKQVCLCLDALRRGATGESRASLAEWVKTHVREAESLSYLPVYYNAWEHQGWDDPLPGLVLAIADAAGVEFDSKDEIKDGKAVL